MVRLVCPPVLVPPTIDVQSHSCRLFSLSVLGETIYANERFALRFRFGNQYPIGNYYEPSMGALSPFSHTGTLDSPEVTFLVSDGWKAPVHPHVYCASLYVTRNAGADPVRHSKRTHMVCLRGGGR
jgi:ubiquitin-protein ligase